MISNSFGPSLRDLAALRHRASGSRTPAAMRSTNVVVEPAIDRDDVLLLVVVLGAQHLVDDVAVVREQDQALGVLVEPADREDPLGMVDEVDDVALDVALGRARDADRLVERDVDRAASSLRAPPTTSPSTLTSSPGSTCTPSFAACR